MRSYECVELDGTVPVDSSIVKDFVGGGVINHSQVIRG